MNGQPTGIHTIYTWDHRNRLVKVQEKPSPTSGTITRVIDQVYDVCNQWVGWIVDPDGNQGSAALVPTYFAYDCLALSLCLGLGLAVIDANGLSCRRKIVRLRHEVRYPERSDGRGTHRRVVVLAGVQGIPAAWGQVAKGLRPIERSQQRGRWQKQFADPNGIDDAPGPVTITIPRTSSSMKFRPHWQTHGQCAACRVKTFRGTSNGDHAWDCPFCESRIARFEA